MVLVSRHIGPPRGVCTHEHSWGIERHPNTPDVCPFAPDYAGQLDPFSQWITLGQNFFPN